MRLPMLAPTWATLASLRAPAVRTTALAFAFVIVGACSRQPAEGAPHVTEAPAPRSDAGEPKAAETAAPAPTPVASAVSPAGDAAKPAAPAPEAPPKVKIVSIGMHVAGGPFDEETKKPYLRAVEPRYPELARCWKHVKEPRQADVGVDLLIPPAGGKPKVSNPRSSIAGEGFIPCVVAFFEGVEFDKTKSGGPQGVSYSVRFKP